MTQTRWFCIDCQREWVYAHHWDTAACPLCLSPKIEQRTYTPAFAGSDIPRDAPQPILSEEPQPVHAQINHTLALSSPEFG